MQALSLDESKMPGTERDYIYDITLAPTDNLLFNLSYGLQFSKTGGVSSQSYMAPSPYTANVYTWGLTTSYAPIEKISLFNSLQYARAKNNTNVDGNNGTGITTTTSPMMMGIDADWYNIDTGLTYAIKKDISVEPHYAYSTYRSFEGVETGNYSAHVIWLDVNVKW